MELRASTWRKSHIPRTWAGADRGNWGKGEVDNYVKAK